MALAGPSSQPLSAEDFVLQQEIFRSRAGIVYKAKAIRTGKHVVLKQRNASELGKHKDILHEVHLLSQLDHPNIVRFLGYFFDRSSWGSHLGAPRPGAGSLYIVLEYCERGDLHALLQRRKARREPLSEDEIWSIFLQICNAVEYVHSNSIIHRDLKSLNVFLTADGVVKVGDFGVGRERESDMQLVTSFYGTPLYLSPEQVDNRPYNEKVDVWSLGVILYELATLETPFQAPALGDLVNKIRAGTYKPVPKTYSSLLQDAVSLLLRTDPARRPAVGDFISWLREERRARNGRPAPAGGGRVRAVPVREAPREEEADERTDEEQDRGPASPPRGHGRGGGFWGEPPAAGVPRRRHVETPPDPPEPVVRRAWDDPRTPDAPRVRVVKAGVPRPKEREIERRSPPAPTPAVEAYDDEEGYGDAAAPRASDEKLWAEPGANERERRWQERAAQRRAGGVVPRAVAPPPTPPVPRRAGRSDEYEEPQPAQAAAPPPPARQQPRGADVPAAGKPRQGPSPIPAAGARGAPARASAPTPPFAVDEEPRGRAAAAAPPAERGPMVGVDGTAKDVEHYRRAYEEGRKAGGRGYKDREPVARQPAGRGYEDREPAAGGRGYANREPAGRQPAGRGNEDREPAGRQPAGRGYEDQEPAARQPAGRAYAAQERAGFDDREPAARGYEQDPPAQRPAGRIPAAGANPPKPRRFNIITGSRHY